MDELRDSAFGQLLEDLIDLDRGGGGINGQFLQAVGQVHSFFFSLTIEKRPSRDAGRVMLSRSSEAELTLSSAFERECTRRLVFRETP